MNTAIDLLIYIGASLALLIVFAIAALAILSGIRAALLEMHDENQDHTAETKKENKED